MRLINLDTLQHEEFNDNDRPTYAILSHTWEREEVTFKDWDAQTTDSHLRGYEKILGFQSFARSHGYKYGWVDTCCIDKSSSAELTEAINSMFNYYKKAAVCLDYLADVFLGPAETKEDLAEKICSSRWMTRGWTLQELIAPLKVVFYDANWDELEKLNAGSFQLAEHLEKFIGIPRNVLLKDSSPAEWSVAQRMSWAARRKTTRVEDQAYCLLGLFDVSLPLIYGEGERAFVRLQEEIIRSSTDHSILAWHFDDRRSRWATGNDPAPGVFDLNKRTPSHDSHRKTTSTQDALEDETVDSTLYAKVKKGDPVLRKLGIEYRTPDAERRLLAPSPAYFWGCREIIDCYLDVKGWVESYEMTNLELRISLPLIPCSFRLGMYHAVLHCRFKDEQKGPIAINLQRASQTSNRQRNTNSVDLDTTTFGVVMTRETETSEFHCSADHLDRLAIVEEEGLIANSNTEFTILRICSATPRPQNDFKKVRLASMKEAKATRPFQPGRLKVILNENTDEPMYRKAAIPRMEWDTTSNIWFVKSPVGVLSFAWGETILNLAFVVGTERDVPFHLALFETAEENPMNCTKLLWYEYESTQYEGPRMGWTDVDAWHKVKRLLRGKGATERDDPVPKVEPLPFGQLVTYHLDHASIEIQMERFESMSKIFHKASITVTEMQTPRQDLSVEKRFMEGLDGKQVEVRQHFGVLKPPVSDQSEQQAHGKAGSKAREEVMQVNSSARLEAEVGRSEGSTTAIPLRKQFSFEGT